MANVGKTAISTESFHSIHTLWCFAGYAAETLIFSLAGIIIGVKISVTCSFLGISFLLGFRCWIKGLADNPSSLYCSSYYKNYDHRAFLSLVETGIWNELEKSLGIFSNYVLIKAAVLSYGGLRGAVGLAMALNIYIDYELKKEARDRVLLNSFSILIIIIDLIFYCQLSVLNHMKFILFYSILFS